MKSTKVTQIVTLVLEKGLLRGTETAWRLTAEAVDM
jgi:hypothetical protein